MRHYTVVTILDNSGQISFVSNRVSSKDREAVKQRALKCVAEEYPDHVPIGGIIIPKWYVLANNEVNELHNLTLQPREQHGKIVSVMNNFPA